MLGKPVGLDKATPMLLSGVAANIAAKTFAPIASIATMVGKDARKAYYKATNSAVVINKKRKQRTPSTPSSIDSSAGSVLSTRQIQLQLKMLNQKLDIMKRRGAGSEIIDKIEDDILFLIEKNTESRCTTNTLSPFDLDDEVPENVAVV